MRFLLGLIPVLLLVSCAPDAEPTLHEINLVGSEYVRVTYFYGLPRTFVLGDSEVTLERSAGRGNETLAVSESLRVDGLPFLRDPLPRLRRAPTEVSYVGGSSDMRVRTGQFAAQVLYYDGSVWFTLLEDTSADVNTRVVPVPRLSGLRGLANLTRAEADALQAYLETGGPLALTVLDEMPGAPRVVMGVEEYLRSGFYLQRQIGTLSDSAPVSGSEVFFDVIASGSNALGAGEGSYALIGNDADLREAWAIAHGAQLAPPALPQVNYENETVLTLFMGSRATGGYDIRLDRLSRQGNEYFADVTLTEPAEGAMLTQALTSPWQIVRILRGGVNSVWIRDSVSGEILGVAVR